MGVEREKLTNEASFIEDLGADSLDIVELVMEFGKAAGFGRSKKPELWIGQGTTSFQSDAQIATITPVHVCVKAKSRADVDASTTRRWCSLASSGRRPVWSGS